MRSRRGHSRLGETFCTEIALTDMDEAIGWIERAGLRLEHSIGIRAVNDYLLRVDELEASAEGYEDLRRLELALGERDPYRRVATLLHLVARRPRAA